MVAVGKITLLLREVEAGREGALDKLMALVYADLEHMAQAYLRKHFGNRAGTITFEPAALDVSISTVSRGWRFAKAWLSETVGLANR